MFPFLYRFGKYIYMYKYMYDKNKWRIFPLNIDDTPLAYNVIK